MNSFQTSSHSNTGGLKRQDVGDYQQYAMSNIIPVLQHYQSQYDKCCNLSVICDEACFSFSWLSPRKSSLTVSKGQKGVRLDYACMSCWDIPLCLPPINKIASIET